jgi:hypothetical protein
MASFLRSRLENNSNDLLPSQKGGIINRSSSAPPVQWINSSDPLGYEDESLLLQQNQLQPQQQQQQHPYNTQNSVDQRQNEALRAHPDYATYYFNNARLDPRLPPPIIAPGQSWKLWASPQVVQQQQQQQPRQEQVDNHYEADPEWHLLRANLQAVTESPIAEKPPGELPLVYGSPSLNGNLGVNMESLMKSNRSDSALASRLLNPMSSQGKKSLVDIIQEDFPRTPSPVYAQLQRPQTSVPAPSIFMVEQMDMRLSSKTPPPAAIGNLIGASLPRSSSTPPQSLHRIRMNANQVVGVSPLHHDASADYQPFVTNQLRALDINSRDGGYDNTYNGYAQANSYGHRSTPSHFDQYHAQQQQQQQQYNQKQPVMVASFYPSTAPPGFSASQEFYDSPNQQRKGRKKNYSYSGGADNEKQNGRFASSGNAVLDDFKLNNRTRKYQLSDVYGNIVAFSCDQHGSRFIQQNIETVSSQEKAMVFKEVIPHALSLMTDVFANYVIQKFFEFGSPQQKTQLVKVMQGHVKEIAFQMYGCRVLQKALESISLELQLNLMDELKDIILQCVTDQNGNHVVQKAVERIPAEKILYIIDATRGRVQSLSTHPYGCRVLQRVFEHCPEDLISDHLKELQSACYQLVQDQYGKFQKLSNSLIFKEIMLFNIFLTREDRRTGTLSLRRSRETF